MSGQSGLGALDLEAALKDDETRRRLESALQKLKAERDAEEAKPLATMLPDAAPPPAPQPPAASASIDQRAETASRCLAALLVSSGANLSDANVSRLAQVAVTAADALQAELLRKHR